MTNFTMEMPTGENISMASLMDMEFTLGLMELFLKACLKMVLKKVKENGEKILRYQVVPEMSI